jgi:hypothetical protein
MLVVTDLEGNPPKVYPIYALMIWRAFKLRDAGDLLGAADRLTTAAETMRREDHPEAERVAGWARVLLDEAEWRKCL